MCSEPGRHSLAKLGGETLAPLTIHHEDAPPVLAQARLPSAMMSVAKAPPSSPRQVCWTTPLPRCPTSRSVGRLHYRSKASSRDRGVGVPPSRGPILAGG